MTHMGTNLHGLDGLQPRRKTTIRIAVLLFVPLVIFGADAAPEGSAYRIAVETFGFLLVFAGILGNAWSTLYIGGRKAPQLVMVGPYSVNRNPLYVITFVAVAGLGAQTGSLVVACLFVAGAYLIFAPVVRHEEGAFDAIFRSESDAYRGGSPAFCRVSHSGATSLISRSIRSATGRPSSTARSCCALRARSTYPTDCGVSAPTCSSPELSRSSPGDGYTRRRRAPLHLPTAEALGPARKWPAFLSTLFRRWESHILKRRFVLAAIIPLSLLPAPALAADAGMFEAPEREATAVASGVDLIFEIGVGGQVSPEYEGSDEYSVSPLPIVGFGYLNIPGLFEIGSTGPDAGGFSISPSFNITRKRKANDFDDLKGLDDVDATYDVGAKVGYEWGFAEIYGEARYAFGGAEGIVGEVGANAIYRPTETIELKAGPFATLAAKDFTETYFGVTAAESARTGFRLEAYDPKGGVKSVGVSGSARYEFREDWFLNADASYSQFVGDAKDSPIVKAGDENQFTVGLGISKRFKLDLFD